MNLEKQKWVHGELDVPSAWRGLEMYMPSIIKELNIKTDKALEFGVDYGYSTYILSKLFNKVIGVDAFLSDPHTKNFQGERFYERVKERFENSNVEIIKSTFEDYIQNDKDIYDLIHVDIVHFYEPTFKCTEWAVQHSNVIILHDTTAYPEMNQVCIDISNMYKFNYYNIPEYNGLGILYK